MSNCREPTFDPNQLPSDRVIAIQNEHDFHLLERGISPSEVASGRTQMEEAKLILKSFYEEVGDAFLRQYGVESADELPEDARRELDIIRADWFAERREGRKLLDE
ncbi:MAG TPA: hypothetical protein VHD84_01495 [Candidatus Saccharimonadales bacterium]|nr:hypothetical protein [Candidatus Saccharimonadales bacterium]